MKVIIDRFEGDFAVCEKENMTMINISKDEIPIEAKEGDVLIIEDNNIIIDKESTKKLSEEIEKLTENMWE